MYAKVGKDHALRTFSYIYGSWNGLCCNYFPGIYIHTYNIYQIQSHVCIAWQDRREIETNKARQVARQNTSFVNFTMGRLKGKAADLIDVHQCMGRSDKDVDCTGKFLNKIATKI